MLDTVGDAPPKQVELPKGLTDDDAVANVAASDSDVCLCRLTLAKECSPAPLFVKASASPHLLPALLLDEHRKHVLQTRGAVAYTSLRSHALSQFPTPRLRLYLLSGCLLAGFGDILQWITRAEKESANVCFNKALVLTKEAKARLVFRPYTTAPLGVVGCATTQGTLAFLLVSLCGVRTT